MTIFSHLDQTSLVNKQLCERNINLWRLVNFSKLNKEKTELLVISTKDLPGSLLKGNLSCWWNYSLPAESKKYLGAIFDSHFCFNKCVTNICKSLFCHLRNISYMRKYFRLTITELLIHMFVSSKLDHCNALLLGLLNCTINSLQDMQIATVHFITFTTKHNHITPFFFIFICFQWITVLFSRFKLLITYKALNNLAPSHVCHMSCTLLSITSTMPIIQAIIIVIVVVIVIVVKRFII